MNVVMGDSSIFVLTKIVTIIHGNIEEKGSTVSLKDGTGLFITGIRTTC